MLKNFRYYEFEIYIYILNLDFGTLKPNILFPIYVSAQK